MYCDRLVLHHSDFQPQQGQFRLHDLHGYGSIPIDTIFMGMNIHLPAILMFTRGTGFDTLPHGANPNAT